MATMTVAKLHKILFEVVRRTKMTQELLPCPHCGNAELDGPHFREYVGDHRCPAWWVECSKCPCGMEAYGETPDELIAAWNKRSNAGVTGAELAKRPR